MNKKIVLSVVVITAALAGGYQLWFGGRRLSARIESHTWVRRISVEEYKSVSDAGWVAPTGAKIRRTTFAWNPADQKTDPYYEYETLDWYPAHELVTSGAGLLPSWPAWPDPSLSGAARGGAAPALGDEREGRRTETYTVALTTDDGGKYASYTTDLSEPLWRLLKDGQTVIVFVNHVGSVREIRPLESGE